MKRSKRVLAAVFLSLFSFLSGCNSSGSPPAQAGAPVATPSTGSENSPMPVAQSTDEDKEAKIQARMDVQSKRLEKQKEVVSEAVAALHETYYALDFLSQSKSKEALASVEKATGKLEVVLARDPSLALAPVAIATHTNDLLADPNEVEKLVKEATALLKDGKVQQARQILATLASETVISTTSIPLGTYPEALKLAARDIGEGNLEEAASVLNEALSTQVVTEVLIPLPLARAEFALAAAEKLAEKSDRTEDENIELRNHLASAERSARLAKALGYGTKADFKTYFEEIESLRKRTSDGKSGNGFFDKIKESLKSLGEQARWLEV